MISPSYTWQMWAWLWLKLPRPWTDQWEHSIQALDQSEASICVTWPAAGVHSITHKPAAAEQDEMSRDAVRELWEHSEGTNIRVQRERAVTSYIILTPGGQWQGCHHCQGVQEDRIILECLSDTSLTLNQYGSWDCELWWSVWLFPWASKHKSRWGGHKVSHKHSCQYLFKQSIQAESSYPIKWKIPE